jgi:hypothetical protein
MPKKSRIVLIYHRHIFLDLLYRSAYMCHMDYTKGKRVKLSLCLTNEVLPREGVGGSECIDSNFLGLGIGWRWMVSFTPRSLYPRKSFPYPLDRRLIGLKEPVWMTCRGENSWPYWDPNSDPSVVQSVTSRYTDYIIPAPGLYCTWLLFNNKVSNKLCQK